MRRVMITGLAVAAVGFAGCTSVTDGTPLADPDQTGITTTTTTTRTTTTRAAPPSRTPTGAPDGAATPPPNGMATTCSEYSSMDDATKLGMVDLLADNGFPGLKRNRFLGPALVGAMCVVAPPGSTVLEALSKKPPR